MLQKKDLTLFDDVKKGEKLNTKKSIKSKHYKLWEINTLTILIHWQLNTLTFFYYSDTLLNFTLIHWKTVFITLILCKIFLWYFVKLFSLHWYIAGFSFLLLWYILNLNDLILFPNQLLNMLWHTWLVFENWENFSKYSLLW